MTGARLDDGTELAADLVVAANGRRSAVAEWLAEIGARPVTETVEDTGIVYASRFYRLLPGAEVPPRTGPIGGDLGYVKYGTFVGDNRTFSITLAVPTGDDELRRRLADPVAFDAAARSLPATAPWLDGRAEPITPEVHMMAGLLNKWSDYVVDGEPAAVGLVPVGDAVLCTNPLYGRGCSTAYWSAHLLAQAIAEHPNDVRAVAVAYDDALRTEIHPWYRSSVEQDREARGSRLHCSPARTPTATPPIRGRSPVRCSATDWHLRCAPTRSCCGPSSAISTCCRRPTPC